MRTLSASDYLSTFDYVAYLCAKEGKDKFRFVRRARGIVVYRKTPRPGGPRTGFVAFVPESLIKEAAKNDR